MYGATGGDDFAELREQGRIQSCRSLCAASIWTALGEKEGAIVPFNQLAVRYVLMEIFQQNCVTFRKVRACDRLTGAREGQRGGRDGEEGGGD
jgi:hypothetical protein